MVLRALASERRAVTCIAAPSRQQRPQTCARPPGLFREFIAPQRSRDACARGRSVAPRRRRRLLNVAATWNAMAAPPRFAGVRSTSLVRVAPAAGAMPPAGALAGPPPEWLQRVLEAAPELRERFALAAVLAASLSQNGTEAPPDKRSLQEGLRQRLRRLCDGCVVLLRAAARATPADNYCRAARLRVRRRRACCAPCSARVTRTQPCLACFPRC